MSENEQPNEETLHIKGIYKGYYHLYSNQSSKKYKISALDLHEHFEERIQEMVRAFVNYCNLNDLFK